MTTPCLIQSNQNASESAADLVLSRSAGLLSQSGNADSELKTRVADEVADDFRRLARSLGMNTSELLRIMVLTRLYGAEGVTRMAAEHLSRVSGDGPQSIPESTHEGMRA